MPKKIYIVDDDRNIVDSLSIVLQSAGYEVGHQYDERNLLQNLTKFSPDLVILDVMFPENESAGFELAREIKGNANTSKIPILMLSAVNEQRIYPGAFSKKDCDSSFLPVSDFIEKPVSPTILLQKVKELLAA